MMMFRKFTRIAAMLVAAAAMATACGDSSPDLSGVQFTEYGSVSLDGGPLGLPTYDQPYALDEDPAVGMQAPVFEGPDMLTGQTVSVGGPSDTPIVLTFYAHWCPHCQAEVAELSEWFADGGTLEGPAELVSVSIFEDPERGNHPPEAWLKHRGWPHSVVSDVVSPSDPDSGPVRTVAAAYGTHAVPYAVGIGTDGSILMRTSGSLGPEALNEFAVAVYEADRSR